MSNDKFKLFDKADNGQMFECNKRDYWIKPEQDPSHHLDGFLINFFNGKIRSITNIDDIRPIMSSEIMW